MSNNGLRLIITFSLFLMLFMLFYRPVLAQVDPNLRTRLQQGPLIVNHRSLNLFDQIPLTYLERARNIRMTFSDRSVGENTNNAINCLASGTWATSAGSCHRDYDYQTPDPWDARTFFQADRDNGLLPSWILFDPDPVKYNRSNWTFEFRGGVWYALTADFVTSLFPMYVSSKDIITYQFSYLNVPEEDPLAGTAINNTRCGFFATGDRSDCHADIKDWHVGRIEEMETQYPNKTFMYWTSSLARGIGTQTATNFNNQMRNYATTHHKILFDFADIESYDPDGRPCYDNRDGIYFCNHTDVDCEDYPDDGLALPAICSRYTSEINGGHLGYVSGGTVRIAKAFWVLMAQIAGWNPDVLAPTIATTATPTLNVTSTPTPTVSTKLGDANADGRVDGIDYVIWLNHYGQQTTSGYSVGDFNSDTRVDGIDYVNWLNHYGT